MANFSLADVKTLREQLGTGMVDTKNALVEADGDLDKAVEILRLKGAKGNAKRADRSTSEGLVAAAENGGVATLIELACETDFVAKGTKFIALADAVLSAVVAAGSTSVEEALTASAGDKTVADLINDEAAILGEKVELRRVAAVSGEHFAIYLHKTNKDLPPQVGVVVGYAGTTPRRRAPSRSTSRSPTRPTSRATTSRRPRSTTSAASSRRSRAARASPRPPCRRSSRDASTRTSSRSPCSIRTTRRTTSCPSARS